MIRRLQFKFENGSWRHFTQKEREKKWKRRWQIRRKEHLKTYKKNWNQKRKQKINDYYEKYASLGSKEAMKKIIRS